MNHHDAPVPTQTILVEASLAVDDREENYGHPAQNFEATALLWSVVLGCTVSVRQVALCMVALKVARELHSPKRDNLIDACGYLRCIEKVQDIGYDADYPHGICTGGKA